MENRLVEHPTDQQIYDSEYRHAGRQGYKRAYLKQQRLAKWQSRNAENTVQIDGRPSGGLDASVNNPYPGSYLARALRAQQPEEAAQAAPGTRIPVLSPSDEKDARQAFETYHYQWTLLRERQEAAVTYGVALGICIKGEVWKNIDQTRRNILETLINSAESQSRFSK